MNDDLFSVKNRTVLITGASRGIGRVLAEGFQKRGAIVYGTGSRPDSVAWMEAAGIRGRVADVSEPGSTEAVVREILEAHGALDCLLNNAGISSRTPASRFKEDEMEKIISTNFKGVFRTCQAYYNAQKNKGGVIVNVASVVALVGVPLASIYSGTKGAVISMSRELAIEWAKSNFRVNCLLPGMVDTDMTAMIKDRPNIREQVVAGIPMGRMGNPADMLGAALFLASDASAYITGQSLIVDGGLTAV